jgi:hypothetical protein
MDQGVTYKVSPDAAKALHCMLYGCHPQLDPQNPLVFFSDITPGGGAIVQGSGFGGAVGPKKALILKLTTLREALFQRTLGVFQMGPRRCSSSPPRAL